MKILITDPLADEGLAILREAGAQTTIETGGDLERIKALLPGHEAWIVRSGTQVTAELLDAAPDLRVIGRAGVGVDNIDVEAATERGVVVMNTPFGNTLSVAELTIGFMFALARHIPEGTASLRRGEWLRKQLKGVELYGKTLGIVGLGRIGREVADRAKGLGMKLVAYDPFIPKDVATGMGIELVTLNQLWPRSDFITVHVPLTPKTKGLVDKKAFAAMKPGVRFINAARGGVVDEVALLAAIESGIVAGAAIDTFAIEPPEGNPLLARPEVICTPHLGASTVEASLRVTEQICQQVVNYLTQGSAENAVNLAASPDPLTAPFVPLAEALGAWAVQLLSGHPERLTVTLRGDAAKAHADLILDATLKGLLEIVKGDHRVSLVNARMVSSELGLVTETKVDPSPGDYPSLITVRLDGADGVGVAVSGTTLGRLGPRIVDVDGYEVEVKPHGRFLVLRHTDQPGTISLVSGLLGSRDVNIAQMVVGRLAPRGTAISVLRVDDPIPDEVMAELAAGKRYEAIARIEV